jgi:acetoin utilization deacetylase AcuC-like enzyme
MTDAPAGTDAVLLLTDAAMDDHHAHGHPERPERRDAVADGVREAAGHRLVEEGCEVVDPADLARVHDGRYLALIDGAQAEGTVWLDADTYLAGGSLHAARLAAGATVRAARAAVHGEVAVAFAVVRPPGHHASAERGGGFCIYNNVAVAVGALRAGGIARRIAVVDWDVHHGDGTQAIFDEDPDLWYASTHQMPLYPGTGATTEHGTGPAAGTKHNRPLAPGTGDEGFVAAWTDELLPAIETFAPEAILVSAGYDAHRDDPLAHLLVTADGYGTVAQALGALARRLGLGGVALTLEGGYDLVALRASAEATVRGLLTGMERAP